MRLTETKKNMVSYYKYNYRRTLDDKPRNEKIPATRLQHKHGLHFICFLSQCLKKKKEKNYLVRHRTDIGNV